MKDDIWCNFGCVAHLIDVAVGDDGQPRHRGHELADGVPACGGAVLLVGGTGVQRECGGALLLRDAPRLLSAGAWAT